MVGTPTLQVSPETPWFWRQLSPNTWAGPLGPSRRAADGHTESGAPHLLLVQQLLQAGLVLGGLRVRQELQILNPEGLCGREGGKISVPVPRAAAGSRERLGSPRSSPAPPSDAAETARCRATPSVPMLPWCPPGAPQWQDAAVNPSQFLPLPPMFSLSPRLGVSVTRPASFPQQTHAVDAGLGGDNSFNKVHGPHRVPQGGRCSALTWPLFPCGLAIPD